MTGINKEMTGIGRLFLFFNGFVENILEKIKLDWGRFRGRGKMDL